VPRRRSSSQRRGRSSASERPEGARPQWSGTLSFGLVSIPVDLYPATRSGGVALRLLAADGTPLARRFYCPEDGKPVPYEHLVRGYEHAKGKHVVVTDEELEALAPEKSRDIDLRSFVARASLDPVYFERAFHLWPSGSSTKAYHLLADVLERTGRAGIGTFVMREREYPVAILAVDGLLRAQTLRFADEIRSTDALGLPRSGRVPSAEVERFAKAIRKEARAGFDPEKLHNEGADALRKLAQQKARSKSNLVQAPDEEAAGDAEVIDLMAVLQRSLGERKTAPRRRTASARRRSR
jgi:DNA end-binding protein Ku